jgi:phosphoribosylformylglycinamidine synthase II
MLLIARREKLEEIGKIFKKWGIKHTVIGRVTSDGILRLKEGENIIAEVPAKSLAEGAPIRNYRGKSSDRLKEMQRLDLDKIPEPEDYNQALLKLLLSPNLCSRKWLYQNFEKINVTGTEVIMSPGDDAGIIGIGGSKKAIAFTVDGNGRYCHLDPFVGGMIAVSEAARNLSCKGALPIAITDNLNFGNPEKEEIFWQLEESVKGISEAARELDIPVISGNVSLNNESNKEAIFPTPVIGMAGIIDDFSRICTLSFKNDNDLVILLGENREELGGSEYLKVFHNIEKGAPPHIDLNLERAVQKTCRECIKLGILSSAHDCSDGGLLISLAESCARGEKGIRVDKKAKFRYDALLFGESQSCIVVSLPEKNLPLLEDIALKYKAPIQKLGEVVGDSLRFGNLVDLKIDKIAKAWEKYFHNV